MGFLSWDDVPVEHNRPGVIHQRLFGEKVQVQRLTVEPGGQPIQLHDHPDIEQFFLIQEGEWEMILGDETRTIGPGDIVYVPPGTTHRPKLLSDKTGYLYEIYHPILSTEIAATRKPLRES